ncbi:MAG: hypothetical protein M1381_03725, partial [Deltaproteobacteria bacterium]|nr:hypothetical protein [Deltaproteobacteria bacterium]
MKKALLGLVAFSMVFAGVRGYADGHRFNRRFDPVVLQGTTISPFLGRNIENFRLYKVVREKGKHGLVRESLQSTPFQPIPFQI